MGRSIRYSVEPKDVSPEKAARRLGLTIEAFEEVLPRLLSRGFPAADLDTGNYDLEAIDAWRRRRHGELFGLTNAPTARDAASVIDERLARLRG